MTPELLGLDHVVIRVRDLAAMSRFYCDVLGCKLDRWRAELGLVHLRAGTAFIDLLDAEKARLRRGDTAPDQKGAPTMDHVCLKVGNLGARALHEYLVGQGAAPGEPVMRYGATGDAWSIYLTDPEGNAVELRAANA